jgi:hypothetical protein
MKDGKKSKAKLQRQVLAGKLAGAKG